MASNMAAEKWQITIEFAIVLGVGYSTWIEFMVYLFDYDLIGNHEHYLYMGNSAKNGSNSVYRSLV
jgi:hypothetical protein